MIETVNVMYSGSNNSHPRRRRATSGSSSSVSYDVPKTPVDAYNELEGGRLGEDFSVIKTRTRGGYEHDLDALAVSHYDSNPTVMSNGQDHAEDVPEWLSDTVASLSSKHPLRHLIPASDPHTPSQPVEPAFEETSPGIFQPRRTDEEDVFAFRPPNRADHDGAIGQENEELLPEPAAARTYPYIKQPSQTTLLHASTQVMDMAPHTSVYTHTTTYQYDPEGTLLPVDAPEEIYHDALDEDLPANYVPFKTLGTMAGFPQVRFSTDLSTRPAALPVSPSELFPPDLSPLPTPYSKPGPFASSPVVSRTTLVRPAAELHHKPAYNDLPLSDYPADELPVSPGAQSFHSDDDISLSAFVASISSSSPHYPVHNYLHEAPAPPLSPRFQTPTIDPNHKTHQVYFDSRGTVIPSVSLERWQ